MLFDANSNGASGAIANNAGSLTVTNCTFSNNINTGPAVNGAGGAALRNVASATINNSTFTNNSATSGAQGGAIQNNGIMTINDSTFTGNSTTATGQNSRGGAISVQGAGQLTINNSLFTGNSSKKEGGAIYWQTNSGTPPLIINNSTFSNNIANSDSDTTGSGGGLFLTGTGSVTITGSTITGNTANPGSTGTGVGGGIYVDMPMTMTNSTVSGNTAIGNGGGIYAAGISTAIVILENCTIVNNTARVNGGGIQRASTTNPVNFRNTIVANNITSGGTSPDLLGTVNSNGFNLIENTTGATIAGDTATNVTGVDPNLGPLQDNGGDTLTHALLAGSPAVDQGGPSDLTIDQRGIVRTFDNAAISNAAGGNGTDIGAFEVELPVVTALVSRRVHGAAGAFDINLLAAPIVTECRSGGNYQVIVTFANPVSVSGLSVMSSNGLAGGTQTVNGAVVTVDLTAVANAQSVGITLINANDGLIAGDVFVPLGVLIGDSNGDALVNSGDALQTRSRSGQTTDGTNFRSDVNADGIVNSGDTSAVRSSRGRSFPKGSRSDVW